jgi:glycolate oxidase FAD binding subunit
MTASLAPASPEELVDAIRSTPRLLVAGSVTKPRLSRDTPVLLSTNNLRGIVEYDPSEFTITAQAGIPLRDIVAALGEKGQRLPFDPMMIDAGGTLGGAVASGLSGPGRFRFGGIRDFILGVRFVDGAGRLMRMGGKVVKNAAGFDLPKFFVGSLGRFGALAEITFKVFPRPASSRTLRLDAADPKAASRLLVALANTRWEPEALDYVSNDPAVYVRLGGPAAALDDISRDILTRYPGRLLELGEADSFWEGLREFRWTNPAGVLVKSAITPLALPALDQTIRAIPGAAYHASGGGNVAFISLPSASDAATLDATLRRLDTPAVTLRGDAPLWLGPVVRPKITADVKQALDAEGRFPSLEV